MPRKTTYKPKPKNEQKMVSQEQVALRKRPSLNSEILLILPKGTTVVIVQKTEANRSGTTFYKVIAPNNNRKLSGWVVIKHDGKEYFK